MGISATTRGRATALFAGLAVVAFGAAGTAVASPKAVYTSTNSPAGN